MTLKKTIPIIIACLVLLFVSITPVFALDDNGDYAENVKYEIVAKCDLKGDFPKDKTEVFSVVVTPDERSPQYKQNTIVISANKSGSFGEISVEVPDVYSYVVYQEKGDNEKITYDTTKYEIVVEVITNDVGLVAKKYSITNLDTNEKVEEVRFINVYEDESPKTSDDSKLELWFAVLGVLALSGIVIGGIYLSERKKNKK